MKDYGGVICFDEAAIIQGKDVYMAVHAYGATLATLRYKGKEMTLNRSFDPGNDEKPYLKEDLNPHYGATCGRVAGRIGSAKYTMANGRTIQLDANNGKHALHGGIKGYSRDWWKLVG